MNIAMLTSQEAVVQFSAADDSNTQRPASFSAVTAPYPAGYTVFVGGSALHIIATAPGTYTVTITGTSADGTALPSSTITVTVTDVAPPPQATHFVLGDPILRTKDTVTPADPGSGTITGSV